MRKKLLATLLLVVGIGIGIGTVYGFNHIWQPTSVFAAAPVNVQSAGAQQAKTAISTTPQSTPVPNQNWNNNGSWMGPRMMYGGGWQGNTPPNQQNWSMGPGMMGGWNNSSGQGNWGMGSGMMGRGMMGNWNGNDYTGQRLTIDQAITTAKQYVANYGQGLAVAEIMEFSNNFYVSVKETATGRGAFELLVDPSSGSIYPEMGPNMMWNTKYGMMGGWMGDSYSGDNTVTIDQAIQKGQQYLDAYLSGAVLQSDGTSFYGHYTFDFKVNNQVAGMLSVNGFDGSVWVHTWHGQFIAEQEVQ
ncbi:MAG: hypothetical protein M1281_04295 [Chloroflexi bacterium]|nr:hypothetical protein [Chloroflexota bacterium]